MKNELKSRNVFRNTGFSLAVQLHDRQEVSVGPHTHEFVELVVIAGGMGVHETDEEAYAIMAGDVFVISLGQAHAYRDTDALRLYNILFEPDQLHMPMADVRQLPGYHALFSLEPHYRRRHRFQSRLRLNLDQIHFVTDHLERMRQDLGEASPGYRFLGVARLMELIGYLSRWYSETRLPGSRTLLRIGEVVTYLETHYTESITLTALAAMAHMSDRSLLRAFQETFGVSPIDYLIRRRISRAVELLRQSDLTITEVSFEVGFKDSNYFSRQFKRVKGTSPREFRKRARVG